MSEGLLLFLGRLALGGIFVLSATPKLLGPRRTMRDVQNYRILPRRVAVAHGLALGPLELAAGLSLVSGYGVRWGAIVGLVLLTSFMLAVGIVMARKRNLECACFGLLYRERVGWATQARDGMLWLLGATIFLGGSGLPPLGDLASASSLLARAGIVVTAVVLAGTFGLGWVAAKGWPRWFAVARRPAPSPAAPLDT